MLRYNIKPNTVDKVLGTTKVSYELLDSIYCKDIHEILNKDYNFKNLSIELSSLNKNNYKFKPRNLINEIQKIAFNQANNCPALTKYADLFYNQIELLDYLNNDKYNSEELLSEAKIHKNDYFMHFGNYSRMGYYVGQLLGWYRVYPYEDKMKAEMTRKVMEQVRNEV